jgi:hypothetical protein
MGSLFFVIVAGILVALIVWNIGAQLVLLIISGIGAQLVLLIISGGILYVLFTIDYSKVDGSFYVILTGFIAILGAAAYGAYKIQEEEDARSKR